MEKFFIFLTALLPLLIAANPQETTFYLVRHGQTDWNVEHRIQGHTDVELNEMGRIEAAQMSEKLADTTFDICFSSDLQRTMETARILLGRRALELKQDERLRERNFGMWEGRLWAELSPEEHAQIYTVENDEAMQKRAFDFLDEMAKKHPGSRILVVTHGGILKNILITLLQRKFPYEVEIKAKNLALVQLKGVPRQYTVQEMEGIQIFQSTGVN